MIPLAGQAQMQIRQHRLQPSSLGARLLRSHLHRRFCRVLHVPLSRIFCLNTRKGFPRNAQLLLLTLSLLLVRTDRYFVAHMFTSIRNVAYVVPADRWEGESLPSVGLDRHHALGYTALVNDIVRYYSLEHALSYLDSR